MVIIIPFLSPVLIMSISSTTLQSEKLIPVFSMKASDAYISESSTSYFKDGKEILEDLIEEKKKILEENDIPAEIHQEMIKNALLSGRSEKNTEHSMFNF